MAIRSKPDVASVWPMQFAWMTSGHGKNDRHCRVVGIQAIGINYCKLSKTCHHTQIDSFVTSLGCAQSQEAVQSHWLIGSSNYRLCLRGLCYRDKDASGASRDYGAASLTWNGLNLIERRSSNACRKLLQTQIRHNHISREWWYNRRVTTDVIHHIKISSRMHSTTTRYYWNDADIPCKYGGLTFDQHRADERHSVSVIATMILLEYSEVQHIARNVHVFRSLLCFVGDTAGLHWPTNIYIYTYI